MSDECANVLLASTGQPLFLTALLSVAVVVIALVLLLVAGGHKLSKKKQF